MVAPSQIHMPNWVYYVLAAGTFLGIVGFDLYLELTGNKTISEWVQERALVLVAFGFLFGWLLGHWGPR